MVQQEFLNTDRVLDVIGEGGKADDNFDDIYTRVAALESEIEDARDGESTLLDKQDAQDDAILATVSGNGSLVSVNDSTPGVLNGKLVAGEAIDLTEGSDGGDETLTISCEDATATNKGVVTLDQLDNILASRFAL